MMVPRFTMVRQVNAGQVEFQSNASSTEQAQTTGIFNGDIKAYFLGNGTGQVNGTKSITWDASKWQLTNAMLNVSAQSDAGNGGSLEFYIGGVSVLTLSWSIFDTSNKSASTTNISSYIINGPTDWLAQYGVAFLPPPGSPDTCVVSSSLVLTFTYIGSGIPPSGPPASTQTSYFGLTVTQILEIFGIGLAGIAGVAILVKLV